MELHGELAQQLGIRPAPRASRARCRPPPVTTRSTSARAAARFSSSRGQEEHGHAVGLLGGKREAEPRRLPGEEAVRHLGEHARAVAGAGVPAHRAAVHEVFQYRDAVGDDLVGAPAVHVDDEPHPAAGVLEEGIVQPFPLHPCTWVVGTGCRSALCPSPCGSYRTMPRMSVN